MPALHRLLFGGLAATALLLGRTPGQTVGVPCLNYNHVTIPPGVPIPPPLLPSCPPPVLVPPGMPFALDVETPLPGMFVVYIVTVGPCCPGFLCVPPAAAPIPPAAPPCGPGTNQSFDLCAFGASFVLVSVPNPMCAAGGGLASLPLLAPAPPFGVIVSIQALILGTPFPPGNLLTNAYTLML
jgi:hypothetical protein